MIPGQSTDVSTSAMISTLPILIFAGDAGASPSPTSRQGCLVNMTQLVHRITHPETVQTRESSSQKGAR